MDDLVVVDDQDPDGHVVHLDPARILTCRLVVAGPRTGSGLPGPRNP